MSKKTILVGCKLPAGLTLDDGVGGQITLNGLSSSMIEGGFGLTHVPEVTWMFLQSTYAEHSAFKSNAVFSYKDSSSVSDLVDVAEDLKDIKTGMEGIDPAKPAPGIQANDPTQVKKDLNANATAKKPAKVPSSKQDQAAAIALATGMDA